MQEHSRRAQCAPFRQNPRTERAHARRVHAMVAFIHAEITVGAVFKNGRAFPRWFLYRGRKISVKEVTYFWEKRQGALIVFCFAVTDGANLYSLSFRPEKLAWSLEAVEDS